MLSGFDWLRRSQTGAELLATLRCLESNPDLLDAEEIGAPPSALSGPCQRCWLYPRKPSPKGTARYCKACDVILNRARGLGKLSRRSVVIWGFVNRLPRQLASVRLPWFRQDRSCASGERLRLQNGSPVPAGAKSPRPILGAYVHDDNRFLVMMRQRQLKPWLQELVIYHGADLTGLFQIVPTTGIGSDPNMADILGRIVHNEASFSMDRLRVQFYAAPYQVLTPHQRDRKGVLTFDVGQFLSVLEMAAVFRTVLYPAEQEMLYDLLTNEHPGEEQFYWGRFLGVLSKEAKDMLNAWSIRQWSREQVELLYTLLKYVAFYQPD